MPRHHTSLGSFGGGREVATGVVSAITAEGASSEIAGLCSKLATGQLALSALGSLAVPALAYVVMLGGSVFLQWKSGQRRDDELRAHFAEIGDAIETIAADQQRAVTLLADIHSRSRFVWAKLDGEDKQLIANRTRDTLRPLLLELGLSKQVDLDSLFMIGEDTNLRVRVIETKLDTIIALFHSPDGPGESAVHQLSATRAVYVHALEAVAGDSDVEPNESPDFSSDTAIPALARSLAKRVAEMESDETALNIRFFGIRETLLAKYRAMGVNIASMQSTIEHIRELFRSYGTQDQVMPRFTLATLQELRRHLRVVAPDMREFPRDLLLRAAKHGAYYKDQFYEGMSEIDNLDRLLPDSLAIDNPDDRWREALEAGLQPEHDDYGLENIGRFLHTTRDILALPTKTFSSGYASHGWVTEHASADLACSLAFACRAVRANGPASCTEPPYILVLSCTDDASVFVRGHYVGRHVDIHNLSLVREVGGGFSLFGCDPDYAYEWDDKNGEPRRHWATHDERDGPVHDVKSWTFAARTVVAVRRRRQLILDDGNATRVLERTGSSGSHVRLGYAESDGSIVEVRANHRTHPTSFYVSRPESKLPDYQIDVEVDQFAHDIAGPGHVDLQRVSKSESPHPAYALSATPILQGVQAWQILSIGGLPILSLRARSVARSSEVPDTNWIVFIDLSCEEPSLLSRPIRSDLRLLYWTTVECGGVHQLFASLLADRTLPHRIAGWRLSTTTRAWEPCGLWHESPSDEGIMEDGLDVHAIPNGNHADVFYVIRRHERGEYEHHLFHIHTESTTTEQLLVLPKNLIEGESAVVSFRD